MKLYVIGNGFDIRHGLKSKYSDFNSFLSSNKKYNDIYQLIVDLYPIVDDWNNFENCLASPNAKEVNYINSVDQQLLGDFKESIMNAFSDWITYVNNTNVIFKDKLIQDFKDEDLFLSFNNTMLLETHYGINESNVCHIHGIMLNNIFCIKSDIIVGHNKLSNTNNSIYDDFVNSFYKDSESYIKKNDAFFNRINQNISKIVVIGHSYSEIDYRYFDKIYRSVGDNVHWDFYYHDSDTENNLNKYLKKLSNIDYAKINF